MNKTKCKEIELAIRTLSREDVTDICRLLAREHLKEMYDAIHSESDRLMRELGIKEHGKDTTWTYSELND